MRYPTTRACLCLPLIAIGLPLGGCVFRDVKDIRDNLVMTNERLDRTETLLQDVGQVNPKLDDLQTLLDEMQVRLEIMKSIDSSLGSMDTTLKSVDKSLMALDQHLASLRRTLENIDSTIPFLKLSDPGPAEDELDAEGAEGEGEAGRGDSGEGAARGTAPPADPK